MIFSGASTGNTLTNNRNTTLQRYVDQNTHTHTVYCFCFVVKVIRFDVLFPETFAVTNYTFYLGLTYAIAYIYRKTLL